MCGIAGVFTPGKEVVAKLIDMLDKEWNRGHTSFGIETYSLDGILHIRKGKGTPDEEHLKTMRGDVGIGHQRYSTRGSNDEMFLKRNAQPIALHFYRKNEGPYKVERCDPVPEDDLKVRSMIVVAHNGDIFTTNEERDYFYQCDIKYLAWPFADELAKDYDGNITKEKLENVARKVIPKLKGSFTFVGYTIDRGSYPMMFAGRDPWGIKPGFIGKVKGGWAVASEDAALVTIGCKAEDIFEMKPGHFYTFDTKQRMHSIEIKKGEPAFCAFEYVYFSDIASNLEGKNVGQTRRELGYALGKEQPANADIVCPVPDSGRSLSIGYAEATGIPFREGLSLNRKRSKRTFILQDQTERENEVLRKLIPIRAVMEGERVVLNDDSLIRGTTMKRIVKMVREIGGAAEVHVRIGCPPTAAPCYLGIDMKSRGEFAAARAASALGYDIYKGFKDFDNLGLTDEELEDVVEKIKEDIGADSLGYLSFETFKKIVGENCCFGCWNPSLNPKELRKDILTAIKEYPEGYRV